MEVSRAFAASAYSVSTTSDARERRAARYEHSLASQLWDNPNILLEHAKQVRYSGYTVEQFMMKLQKVEESYCNSLFSLVSSFYPIQQAKFQEGPGLTSAFDALLKLTLHRAQHHQQTYTKLSFVLEAHTLLGADEMLAEPSLALQTEIGRAAKSLSKEERKVVKAQNKYNSSVTGALKSLQKKMKVSKPFDIEDEQTWRPRLQELDPRKAKDVDTVTAELKNCQIAEAMVRALYQETVSTKLDDYQRAEYGRIDKISGMFLLHSELHSKLAADLYKQALGCCRHVRAVTKEKEVDDYAKSVGSGASCPWMELPVGKDVDPTETPSARQNRFSRSNILRWRGKDEKRRIMGPDQIAAAKMNAQNQKDEAIAESKRKEQKQAEQKQAEQKQAEQKQKEVEAQKRKEEEARMTKVKMEKEKEKQLREKAEREKRDKEATVSRSGKLYKDRPHETIKASCTSDGLKPIVIDNGSAYIKAGYSGTRTPAFVIPSVVANFDSFAGPSRRCTLVGASASHLADTSREGVDVNRMVFCDDPNWDDLEEMWDYIFTQLGADPKEHPVIMTQPTLPPLKLETTMSEIMFEKFEVPCLYVATAPLMAAYAYGSSTGLVIDVGHSSAQVLPVVDGYLIAAHVNRVKHVGGLADTNRIVKYYEKFDPKPDPARILLHSMSTKDRMAFCASSVAAYEDEMDVLATVQGFLGGADNDPEAEKQLPPKVSAIGLQRELLQCGETLFQPKIILDDADESILSIPELIAEIVGRCDVDTRRDLLSNVFLSGGVTQMRGFKQRLTAELKDIISHASYYINVTDSAAQYAPWTGASVVAEIQDFVKSWRWRDSWLAGEKDKIEKPITE